MDCIFITFYLIQRKTDSDGLKSMNNRQQQLLLTTGYILYRQTENLCTKHYMNSVSNKVLIEIILSCMYVTKGISIVGHHALGLDIDPWP